MSDETRDVEKPLSATPGWDESVRDAAAWTRTWLNPSQLIDVSASPAMLAETRARGASGGSSRRTRSRECLSPKRRPRPRFRPVVGPDDDRAMRGTTTCVTCVWVNSRVGLDEGTHRVANSYVNAVSSSLLFKDGLVYSHLSFFAASWSAESSGSGRRRSTAPRVFSVCSSLAASAPSTVSTFSPPLKNWNVG